MRSGELVRVEVDPALVLAEVLLRLRHAGAEISTDEGSMSCAYEHLTGVLVALGVPVDVGVLGEADYMFLRCVAASSLAPQAASRR